MPPFFITSTSIPYWPLGHRSNSTFPSFITGGEHNFILLWTYLTLVHSLHCAWKSLEFLRNNQHLGATRNLELIGLRGVWVLAYFLKTPFKSFLKIGDPNIQPELRTVWCSLSFFLEEFRFQNVHKSEDGFLGGKELTHPIEGGRHLSGSNCIGPVPARRELSV